MVRRVCVVTPGNLAFNPRAMKEVEALHDAGYDVTAVSCNYADAFRPYDDALQARVLWRMIRVERPASRRLRALIARGLASVLDFAGARLPLDVAVDADRAAVPALKDAACGVPADLYIAHYVAALPAAAAAACRHGAMLGFDAEDFHSSEGTGGSAELFRMKIVKAIEAGFLRECAHMTAASPLIGEAYGRRYGLTSTTILNVFPLDMAPNAPQPGSSGRIRAYWFSQTIGLDRGLQAFIAAMARAKTAVTLDIRGDNRWGHGDTLVAQARALGIGDRVTLLPVASPEEMARLAAEYDLGLSLETDISENRRICLTNKIFTYLLAGVPVMMSDTPAQQALAPDLGAAASVVSLADPAGIARALDALPARQVEARATAWRLGRQRYNWEVEKGALLEAVARAFDGAKEKRACASF